jgi:hypothetical protein
MGFRPPCRSPFDASLQLPTDAGFGLGTAGSFRDSADPSCFTRGSDQLPDIVDLDAAGVARPSTDFPDPDFFTWRSDWLPDPLDLHAAIPSHRFHVEGVKVSTKPSSLSREQLQCLHKNRLYSSAIRDHTQWVSFLLDRYKHMDPDVIRVVIQLLPDSYGTQSKRRIRIDEPLANASMFNRCDDGPWLSYSLRCRPAILPSPVAVVRFTPEQLNQHGMPG